MFKPPLVLDYLRQQTWLGRNTCNKIIREISDCFYENRTPDLSEVPSFMQEDIKKRIASDRIAFDNKDKEMFVVKEKYNYLFPMEDRVEKSRHGSRAHKNDEL
jgi:hypothetical protein